VWKRRSGQKSQADRPPVVSAAELVEHGYRISPGSLHPTLHEMEAEGRTSELEVTGLEPQTIRSCRKTLPP
jgi:hypothetical protein